MKIGVIGTGYWGKNLVRNFSEIGALSCICDSNPEAGSELAAKYKVPLYATMDEMLGNEPKIAVAAATPAATHYDVLKSVLQAGHHAFVEKPLALNVSEAEELINIADKKNLTLMIGHLLQYHSGFRKLKDMARSGELGKINYIFSSRLNLGKIRREENILWSFAPHDISMILSLAGEEPESVTAIGHNFLSKAVADITTTHLSFLSGIAAHIFVSWLHPFKEQKLVVVGDKNMAVFDDTKPWNEKLVLYPHTISWKDGAPVPDKKDAQPVELEESEPLKEECLHFLESIDKKQAPLTDGREGLRVLQVLDAAQRSLEDQARSKTVAMEAAFFAHETAVIDKDVTIGERTKIWHFTHIMPDTAIGRDCVLGQNVTAGPSVTIGNNVKIQNNVSVYKGVEIEDDVFCGPSMVFTNVMNPRSFISRKEEFRKTRLRKGCSVGANAVIVCGNTIGQYAFVGAGSVVTRDVPDFAMVYGNPAKVEGWVCACGVKLEFKKNKAKCSACEKKYQKKGNTCSLLI